MASRENLAPERIARDSRSSLFPMSSMMLGDLPSTSDRMKVAAEDMDTVDRKSMREARNMRSGTVDF